MADVPIEILVVESDKVQRDQIRAGFQSFSRFTVTCAEGFAGINLVRTRGFDYVLIGIPASDSEGMQLLKSLREFNRDLEVVVVTSHRQAKTMAGEKSRLNIFAFLDAPIDAGQFFRTVARLKPRERVETRPRG